MRKISILILFVCCTAFALAQKNLSADKLYHAGEYKLASEKYERILKTSPYNTVAIFRYARCVQELGDVDKAMEYYAKLSSRHLSKYLHMGDIYVLKYNPDAAIEAYNMHLEVQDRTPEELAIIAKKIKYAELLKRYLRRVERIVVVDSMLVPMDKMLDCCQLSTEAGQLQYDSLLGVLYTNQRADLRLWSQRVDSTSQLYSSHRLLDTWTEPEPLPVNVNFTVSQQSPYLLGDGVTLYFAAQDTAGFGGLDIYVTRYNTVTEQYTEPDNIGFPYNSPANEYMLLIDEVQQRGYLATDRFAPAGYVHIYTYVLPEIKQYWRGLSTESLAEYAQLSSWDKAGAPSESTLEVESTDSASEDFFFVLNDSVVYTTATDFVSPEAYVVFMEWEKQSLKLQYESEQLYDLRLQYMEASEAERQELAPIMLQLEANYPVLKQYCQSLLLEARRLESSARGK